jgi:stage V sporulation protein R
MSLTINSNTLLFENADWDFATIQRINDAVEEIALKELGLNVYPNQIEVISTEQMLDAYSSIGMPLFYKHWSFGKQFARNEALYRAGMQGSRLRDRDQFQSRHQLHHGGKHRHDADAGDCARCVRA